MIRYSYGLDKLILKLIWKDKYAEKGLKTTNKGGLDPLKSKTYSKYIAIKMVVLVQEQRNDPQNKTNSQETDQFTLRNLKYGSNIILGAVWNIL